MHFSPFAMVIGFNKCNKNVNGVEVSLFFQILCIEVNLIHVFQCETSFSIIIIIIMCYFFVCRKLQINE